MNSSTLPPPGALAKFRRRGDHSPIPGHAEPREAAILNESEDKEPAGGRANLVALAAYRNRRPEVAFSRSELDEILRVYGRKVATGEWRDYAIDHLRERAVFSIYRRSSEVPLYRIVKQPKSARRPSAYSVMTAGGQIVERGPDLGRVLRVLDSRLTVVA